MKTWQKGLTLTIFILIWLTFVPWTWLSGPRNGGFLLFGSHDSLWHLSLIAEIAKRGLPPQFPGMNGVLLNNYNYLGDLFWGIIVKALNIPAWLWYFRIGSFLVINSFLLTIFLLSKKIANDWQAGIFAVLLTTLGGTAAFLIPSINSSQKNWQANSFMLSSIANSAIHLHAIFAGVILLLSLYFYYSFFKYQKMKNGVLAGIFMGILFGIKALYFLPFFLASCLISVIALIKKEVNSIMPTFVGLIVFIILFKFFVKPANGLIPFQLRPFWLIEKMVENPDRFYWPKKFLLDQQYHAANDFFRLTISTIEKIFLYLVGNFWLRLLGIFWLLKKTVRKNSSRFYQLSLLTIVFSALLPLLIVPQPDHYNAVQIGRVGMFLSALFLGVSLRKKPIIFLIVFALTIPTAFKSSYNTLFINNQEYQALNFLKNNSYSKEVVMDLVENHQDQIVVPALAQRKTYFSDTKQADLFGINYQERLNLQKNFLKGKLTKEKAEEFLRENNIAYIYTSTGSFNKEQEKKYELDIFFQNAEITIYLPLP